MANEHRYVIMNNGLWRISQSNYRKVLEMAKGMKTSGVTVNPEQYHMVQVDTIPPNWTTLSSAEAEALLLGMSARKAAIVEGEQGRIEGDVADLSVSPTEMAQQVIEGQTE